MMKVKCLKCSYKSSAITEFYNIETPNYIFWLCVGCAVDLEEELHERFAKSELSEEKKLSHPQRYCDGCNIILMSFEKNFCGECHPSEKSFEEKERELSEDFDKSISGLGRGL